MTQRTTSLKEDRRVHAEWQGTELVRYDRAGKWWVEQASGAHWHVGIADAVLIAKEWKRNGGNVFHGLPGGSAFDRMVGR